MKVTKISQQVKQKDRYSVYIDETYSFSLSEYQLAASGLRIGREFTADELEQFIDDSKFGKAYERSLNYVMIRPRSQKEIRDYLNRVFMYPKPKVYTDKAGQRHIKPHTVNKQKTIAMIERVIERLDQKGYIDDQAFALAWVGSRQLHKSLSLRKLKQELMSKGIASDIIATTLQKQNIDELDNLQQLVAKKRRLSKYQDEARLTRYLASQGFNYDDIKTALLAD